MSTITAVLEPSVDGMLHLALPRELLGKKVRVTAQVEIEDDDKNINEEARRKLALQALRSIAASGAFDSIEDPVAWQREIRKDRPLPGREE